MKMTKHWAYNYQDKCDCSEDDNCGCSYPENMERNYQECESPIKTVASDKPKKSAQ